MPIYAYKCASCGHSKDVLQKMSDPPLTDCPQCGTPHFQKQLTSAGFQLKGSGWYVTDFRGGNAPSSPAKDAAASGTTDAAPAAPTAAASPPAPAPAAAEKPKPTTSG